MTQAITSNILNSLKDKTVSAADFWMDKNISFNNVFNKTKTLGDIKESANTVKSMKDFREFLQQAAKEANMEDSLDSTQARDINDIIAQLKETLSNALKDNGKDVEDDASVIDNALFEQILLSLDKDNNASETEQAVEDVIAAEDIALEEPVIDIPDAEVSDKVQKADMEDSEQALDEDILNELNIESIEAETDSAGGGSLMQQSPQEQAVKAMIHQNAESFDVKIQQASETAQAKPVEISSNKILEQISKQMEALQNNSKVNIVLNPESLGKVTIQLVKSPEGLSAQFTTATQEARDLLMKGLDGLKETLMSHGVSVDNVSVKLNSAQKSEYNPDWTEQEGSRGGNKQQGQSGKNEKEKELFEQMMAQTTDVENGKV